VSNAQRSGLALILAHVVAGSTLSGVTVGDTPPPISAARWYNTSTPLIVAFPEHPPEPHVIERLVDGRATALDPGR
jgi:hypothetical protein